MFASLGGGCLVCLSEGGLWNVDYETGYETDFWAFW